MVFNLKLPLQYINLEIGDLVKFEDLFIKAYGIDYRILDEINAQYRYPLFMVTSTQKNLDSVSIECMQLHHLGEEGDIDENWGDITFPDSVEIVIPEAPVDEDLSEEGEQIEVPNGYYYISDDELRFIKEDGVLLFDYTIYSFLNEGELIRIKDNENNIQEFRIVSISSNYYRTRFTLEPIDLEGFGDTLELSDMSDGGDLLITELISSVLFEMGDINQDGVLSITDIGLLVSAMQGQITLTESQFELADMDGDGVLSVIDVIRMMNRILGTGF